jgi:hypothetical protein
VALSDFTLKVLSCKPMVQSENLREPLHDVGDFLIAQDDVSSAQLCQHSLQRPWYVSSSRSRGVWPTSPDLTIEALRINSIGIPWRHAG